MRVLHLLEHLQLVVDHLLVSAHVLLQDDLDRDLALGALGLSDDAIGSGAQRLSKAVSRPADTVSKDETGGGGSGGGGGAYLRS